MTAAEVGERVRAARQSRGLTMVALAEKVGVTQAFISKLESGRTFPALDTAVHLAQALGISLDEMVGLSESQAKRLIVTGESLEPIARKLLGKPLVAPANHATFATAHTDALAKIEKLEAALYHGGKPRLDDPQGLRGEAAQYAYEDQEALTEAPPVSVEKTEKARHRVKPPARTEKVLCTKCKLLGERPGCPFCADLRKKSKAD